MLFIFLKVKTVHVIMQSLLGISFMSRQVCFGKDVSLALLQKKNTV